MFPFGGLGMHAHATQSSGVHSCTAVDRPDDMPHALTCRAAPQRAVPYLATCRASISAQAASYTKQPRNSRACSTLSSSSKSQQAARLRESEDVVDEEQHVLVLDVAKVLGDGKARERNARPGPRRLVHLAVHERALALAPRGARLDDAGFDHLVVEVGAFARALADAGKDAEASVALGHIVDELHDKDSLADAGAAEEANLAAALVRREQVDDLRGYAASLL